MSHKSCEPLEDENLSCMFLYETYYCEECHENYLMNNNYYMSDKNNFQKFIFAKYEYP